MPQYKLYYFDFRGRGETIRILLSLAGADWEDVKVSFADFKTMKESGILPFDQLPALEVDGLYLGQSMAIVRYLAKEFDLTPASNLQLAVADSIVDQVQDCTLKVIKMTFEKDESKKEELVKDLFENALPQNMKFFDKILKENCQGKTFFFGDKMTYVDAHFFSFVNGFIGNGKLEVPDALKEFPALVNLYNGVMNEPKVLEYLKKRTTTDI